MRLEQIRDELAAPFPSHLVKWRALKVDEEKGRALVVAYVATVSVMDRLDEVVGPDEWTYDFDLLADRTTKGKLTVLGVTKCNRGGVEGKSISASDRAKGDTSDGLKRCAVLFHIGRYLARVGSAWVPYDLVKKTFVPPELPDWALPQEQRGRSEGQSCGGEAAPMHESVAVQEVEPAEDAVAPAPESQENETRAGQDCSATAGDFWDLGTEALKERVKNEEIQAIAQAAGGDWGKAIAELQRRMLGEQVVDERETSWLDELGEDQPEDVWEEVFGS